ncbi:Double-stranded RNA-specific editase Adar [Papilio machaon]|uniref:Double-stranded RNA-specific editase Adar n=1 Tax=Papilio machaon TaxID=76193 RepID=A0A0N1IPL2_PAPMA|nr:Double-stranded RNA-specific editase Adar [Papilio machaon]
MDSNSADITGKDQLSSCVKQISGKAHSSVQFDSSISSSTDIKMPDMDVDSKDTKPILTRPKSDGPPPKRQANAIPLDGFKWNMQFQILGMGALLIILLQALATAADAVESGGKSPVSALNELGVRVNYTLRQQGGPPHCPSFVITVEVADMKFEGFGHSKREARAAAARACLTALMQRAGRLLPAPPRYQDFTSDETTAGKAIDAPSSPLFSPSTSLFGSRLQASNKSPINMLYENYPGLSFICTYGDGSSLDSAYAPFQLSHSMRFKVVCKIKDYRFEGYGSSKKLAKVAAARVALAELGEARAGPQRPLPAAPLNQLLADHVAREKQRVEFMQEKVAAARVALAELGEARAGPQRPLPAAPLNQLLADHVAR